MRTEQRKALRIEVDQLGVINADIPEPMQARFIYKDMLVCRWQETKKYFYMLPPASDLEFMKDQLEMEEVILSEAAAEVFIKEWRKLNDA